MANEAKKGIYETLREINVNEHTEKKGNLTYLSWVWALDQLYLHYPAAEVEVHKNPDGWPYWTDGRTCWVDVEVKIPDESIVVTETAGAVNFYLRDLRDYIVGPAIFAGVKGEDLTGLSDSQARRLMKELEA